MPTGAFGLGTYSGSSGRLGRRERAEAKERDAVSVDVAMARSYERRRSAPFSLHCRDGTAAVKFEGSLTSGSRLSCETIWLTSNK